MNELDYIPIEAAREQLGISPLEMSILLEAKALRTRVDPHNNAILLVNAEEVQDAVEHLSQYRQEEKERINHFITITGVDNKAEAREVLFFNLSDTDLMTLLLASVSYFDAERDISHTHLDSSNHILQSLKAIEHIYGRLKKESAEGRSPSEIITEMYEQRPDFNSRNRVMSYLMHKTR